MRLGELSDAALRERLCGPGLNLVTGPFVNRIRCALPAVREGLRIAYAEHELAHAEDYADFHVRLANPGWARRWFRPQVQFYFDGFLPFKPLPAAQAFPLLEWGLNWCVGNHCHQYLILHAAVLERRGRCLILPGAPGAGKSTLCAGLVYGGGWRLLSDELCLIRREDGLVQPLPRPVSLKNGSIAVIQAFVPGLAVTAPAQDTSKGTVAHVRPPADSVCRERETAKPAWVVFPHYRACAETRLEPMPRGQAYMRLVEQSFNYSLLSRDGFETLAGLVEGCEALSFEYSRLAEALPLFEALASARRGEEQRV